MKSNVCTLLVKFGTKSSAEMRQPTLQAYSKCLPYLELLRCLEEVGTIITQPQAHSLYDFDLPWYGQS